MKVDPEQRGLFVRLDPRNVFFPEFCLCAHGLMVLMILLMIRLASDFHSTVYLKAGGRFMGSCLRFI